MKTDKNELIDEINKENKEVEEAAFRLFCKHKLGIQMKLCCEAEANNTREVQKMEDLTIKHLEAWKLSLIEMNTVSLDGKKIILK